MSEDCSESSMIHRWDLGHRLYNCLRSFQGSFENAISGQIKDGRISRNNFIIGLRREYVGISPFAEEVASSYYKACKQNASLLLVTYMSLVYSKLAVLNSSRLFHLLCKMLSIERERLRVDDLLTVLCLGDDSKEVDEIRELILKPDRDEQSLYTRKELDALLSLNPQLLLRFSDKLGKYLPLQLREEVISKLQSQSIEIVRNCLERAMLKKSIEQWKLLLDNSPALDSEDEIILLQWRMRYWKADRLLRTWKLQTEVELGSVSQSKRALKHYSEYQLRKNFSLWRRLVLFKKNYRWKPRVDMNLSLGMSKLRKTYSFLIAKECLYKWKDEVLLLKKIEWARSWNRNSLMKRHLSKWFSWFQHQRNLKIERDHRRYVSEMFAKMELSEIQSRNDQPVQNEACMEVGESRKTKALQRRTEYNNEIDTSLLKDQKLQKTLRLLQKRQAQMEKFEAEWNRKKEERINDTKAPNEVWFKMQEGKEQLLKFVNQMKREIQFPTKTSTPFGQVILAKLDALLTAKGVLVEDFLSRLDKDGTITVQSFVALVKDLELNLPENPIYELFDELGNSLATSKVAKQQIVNSLEESRTWCGIEGTQWKRFIDPIQNVIVYHHIVEDKIVPDYKLRRRTMYAIARDHFLARNIIQEYKKIKREKSLAQRIAREHDAANTIQRNWLATKMIAKTRRRIRLRQKRRFECEMNSNIITI